MSMYETLQKAVKVIQDKKPNFTPKVGLILGSGLGPLADELEGKVEISYADLPGFPVSRVKGHEGSLILGTLKGGVPVACLKGRVHMYEGSMEGIKVLIRTLKMLGCHTLVTTNAVGSLKKEAGPGEIMVITDHINFVQLNPLVGPNDEEFGERFVPMNDAYDPELRVKALAIAKDIELNLHESVYLATYGPTFETPAEIRAIKLLGGDSVGMSTVPDVIVARHCGLKVLGLSAVTNYAAGMSEEAPSHEGTLYYAQFGAEKLLKLLRAFFEKYGKELSQ